MSNLDIVLRVLLAVVFSGAVGYEREVHGKSAGLRTHSLVGIGATMFTIVSIIGFEGGDESRVAAQIVTGVGFLGAGAIFREGGSVEGLTTAAGLWAVAAIGMGTGSGAYLLAFTGTAVVLGVLYGLYAVDLAIERRKARAPAHIEVTLESANRVTDIVKFSKRIDDSIRQLDLERLPDGGAILTCEVHPDKADLASEMLASLKGVAGTRIVPPLERRRFEGRK